MSLRKDIINAVKNGVIPTTFCVADVKTVVGNKYSSSYVNSSLANSEVLANYSPTYRKFTIRIGLGEYALHPSV